MDLKSIQKALGFNYKSLALHGTRNIEKAMVKQRFRARRKVVQNTLSNQWNLNTFEAISAKWTQKAFKSIQKALCFH